MYFKVPRHTKRRPNKDDIGVMIKKYVDQERVVFVKMEHAHNIKGKIGIRIKRHSKSFDNKEK